MTSSGWCPSLDHVSGGLEPELLHGLRRRHAGFRQENPPELALTEVNDSGQGIGTQITAKVGPGVGQRGLNPVGFGRYLEHFRMLGLSA